MPALFSAMHLNIPRCWPSSDAIFRTLVLADNLTIAIPKLLFVGIGDELRVHLMLIGRSPFIIIQETPVLSPVFKDSFPNEKCDI